MRMQRYAEVLSIAAAACCLVAGVARAQSSAADAERIALLRSQIKSAEEQHAGVAETGELWLRLANRYQNELEFADAEDAFGRSLRLLHAAGLQAEAADALDGMGSVYLATGRLAQAKDYLGKCLAIYQDLGDRAHAEPVHEAMAQALLFDRRYRESQAQSEVALAELQSLGSSDPVEMVAAYLTHSYALCFQGHCAAALDDVDRALAVAQAKLPADSLEMVEVRLVQGFEQWRAGSPEDGGRSLQEALRIARQLRDVPSLIVVKAQMSVLQQHAALLIESHRKGEARPMEAEVERLQAQLPAACSGCTVSVAALSLLP